MDLLLARLGVAGVSGIHLFRDAHEGIVWQARIDGTSLISDGERSTTLDGLAELGSWSYGLARWTGNAIALSHMYHGG